jgi:hypothetical protein
VPLRKIKEAFAAKRMQWVTLGKPKGTIQKSKFDKDREKIKLLLKLVGTLTISRSTPALTKGSYSILDGTWLHERLYRAI